MARRSFRDRFLTPQVARALWSPSGILAAGAGAAVGIVATAPIGIPVAIAAAGAGALAWAGRVALAIPRDDGPRERNPFELDEPWRTSAWQARKAQREFADAVRTIEAGPLRERLEEVADRMAEGVEECWEVAQSGHRLARARARIDIPHITAQLRQLPTGAALRANPAQAETAEALQNQLDAARRMDEVIATTRDQLRLLDARLGETVTRVLELSARPQRGDELNAIGEDVDDVVHEMEALRQALDETDAVRPGRRPASAPAAPVSPASTTAGPSEVSTGAGSALGTGDPATAIPDVTGDGRVEPVTRPAPPAAEPPAPQTWPPTPPS